MNEKLQQKVFDFSFFAMSGQASTLVINTGTTGGDDDYNPIDTGN